RSPTAIDSLNALRDEMHRARVAGDWHAYLDAAKRQVDLLNGSPMSHLEVARADMHLNDLDAALNELRDFVHMGQTSELLETLPELAPLRKTAGFTEIKEDAANNRKTVSRASLAFRLNDHGLLPEDIDYDPGKQRFFISSVLQKKIVTATMRGELA